MTKLDWSRRACQSPKWAVTKRDLARHYSTFTRSQASVIFLGKQRLSRGGSG